MVGDLEVKISDGILKIDVNDRTSITYPVNGANKEPILSFRDGTKALGSSLYQKDGDLWKPLMPNLDLEFGKGSRGYEAFERIISKANEVQRLFDSTLERYIINKDEGTISDTHTGLIWDDDWTQKKDWNRAVKHAKDKGNGSSLPTDVQFKSLGDDEECYPTPTELKDIGFNLPDRGFLSFWTSKEHKKNKAYAWYVSFYSGAAYNSGKTNPHYVVCVR